MKQVNRFQTPRPCYCLATDKDPLVKNDLAITPHRMHELTLQGIAISEQTANMRGDFIDGYSDCEFEPPHIYQRHADIISAWNTQIETRQNVGDYVDSLNTTQNG